GGRRRRGLAGGQGQEQQEDGGAQAHGGSGSFRGGGNDDAARRRRRGTGLAPSLLEVVQHPLDGGDDLLVGQGRVAALGRHHAGAALEAVDGVLVQGVHALGDAGGPGRALQLGRAAGAGAVAGRAQGVVDDRTVQGAVVGDL